MAREEDEITVWCGFEHSGSLPLHMCPPKLQITQIVRLYDMSLTPPHTQTHYRHTHMSYRRRQRVKSRDISTASGRTSYHASLIQNCNTSCKVLSLVRAEKDTFTVSSFPWPFAYRVSILRSLSHFPSNPPPPLSGPGLLPPLWLCFTHAV